MPFLRLISEKQLPVKIIALGATETRQQVEQLYKSGVDKYLETDSSLSDLIGVIRLAAGTVR